MKTKVESLNDRIKTLRPNHFLRIVAPRIEHLLTGTIDVGIARDGKVMVKYEDGKIEERQASSSFLDGIEADNPSLFEIVSFVQEGRTTA